MENEKVVVNVNVDNGSGEFATLGADRHCRTPEKGESIVRYFELNGFRQLGESDTWYLTTVDESCDFGEIRSKKLSKQLI